MSCGLDREADGDFGRAVENLKDMITEQAMVLALGPFAGSHFNTAIASAAFRASDIGFDHEKRPQHPRNRIPAFLSVTLL
jgi:hypothetical protein